MFQQTMPAPDSMEKGDKRKSELDPGDIMRGDTQPSRKPRVGAPSTSTTQATPEADGETGVELENLGRDLRALENQGSS